MSILKPVPVVPQVDRKLCPHCGKASYSRDGIHPQCALNQADAVRYARLREKRKLEPKEPAKPKPRVYSKKCPKCGTQLHLRIAACTCGYKFPTTKQ